MSNKIGVIVMPGLVRVRGSDVPQIGERLRFLAKVTAKMDSKLRERGPFIDFHIRKTFS
jgi:hypothetical protein